MKTSTQLKALIRNMAKEKQVGAEVILRSFMMERLLERISKSQYKDIFILKGGMLIASMVGINARNTMDLDVSVKDAALTEESLIKMMKEIPSLRKKLNIHMT